MSSEKIIKCPYCGYEGKPGDFTYMYESVLYLADDHVVPEERDRPLLIICPRCKRGFFEKSPYQKLLDRLYSAK